jgi:Na+/proline symporter
MNTWAFVVVVVATVVLTNAVAFLRRGKRASSFVTYFADPDYHGSFSILLSIVGTVVGGGMFLAVGQIGFEAGITGIIIGVAYVVGFSLVGVFAPTFRRVLERENCQTLVDLLEKMYSRRVAVQFSAVSAAMYFFLLAGQFVALYDFAKYSEALASHTWVPWMLVGLGAFSMLVYPVIGGLRKDISTDVFQVLLVSVAALALAKAFFSDPLATQIWSNLPPEHLSGTGNPSKGNAV